MKYIEKDIKKKKDQSSLVVQWIKDLHYPCSSLGYHCTSSIPGLGTSTCHGHSQKTPKKPKKKKKKKTKKKKKKAEKRKRNEMLN